MNICLQGEDKVALRNLSMLMRGLPTNSPEQREENINKVSGIRSTNLTVWALANYSILVKAPCCKFCELHEMIFMLALIPLVGLRKFVLWKWISNHFYFIIYSHS